MSEAQERPTAGDPYSAGVLSHELPTEEARLRWLEAQADPQTFALLESLGIAPGWRCLELGGGGGSVARWLAGRCPEGHVTATDVDTRFLAPDAPANLTVLRHDATVDAFPPASFDLVHTRAVLHHLPTREAVLARAVEWVAPGGWLVVEDPDFTCTDSSPYPAARAFASAFKEFMAERQGTDYTWAARLPSVVARLGLRDPAMSIHAYHSGPGAASGRAFWRATVAQSGPAVVSAGLVSADVLAEALALLEDPGYLDQLFTMVAAWGRRSA